MPCKPEQSSRPCASWSPGRGRVQLVSSTQSRLRQRGRELVPSRPPGSRTTTAPSGSAARINTGGAGRYKPRKMRLEACSWREQKAAERRSPVEEHAQAGSNPGLSGDAYSTARLPTEAGACPHQRTPPLDNEPTGRSMLVVYLPITRPRDTCSNTPTDSESNRRCCGRRRNEPRWTASHGSVTVPRCAHSSRTQGAAKPSWAS